MYYIFHYYSLINTLFYDILILHVQRFSITPQKAYLPVIGLPILYSAAFSPVCPNYNLFKITIYLKSPLKSKIKIGGEERPVLYISRKLSKRETIYSTIEKECLAIRWEVLTLRYYLLGQEFTLCSDHAPLQWLHRMKDTNARITHWYLALQAFKFKVVHRPGTQMTVADFLSRNGGGGGAAGRRAMGVCGEGGGVQRSLQRERDSADSGK